MTEEKLERGHCPNCGPDKLSSVRGIWKVHDEDHEYGVYGWVSHSILECRACQAVYIQKRNWFSEDPEEESITHWPSPAKRKEPSWLFKIDELDSELNSLMNDIYTALNADIRVLAAVGVRTAFEVAATWLGVRVNGFANTINELEKQGKIGTDEKDVLKTLIDAGNAAAHRGWKPTLAQLETMMEILEQFIYRNFILGDAARTLKASVPPRT